MSKFTKYRSSRVSSSINVLGSFCVEIVATDDTRGFATGFDDPKTCWIVKNHFLRLLKGADPRDIIILWYKMFIASMFYGRNIITVISVIDLVGRSEMYR